jgi:hypothetical protein
VPLPPRAARRTPPPPHASRQVAPPAPTAGSGKPVTGESRSLSDEEKYDPSLGGGHELTARELRQLDEDWSELPADRFTEWQRTKANAGLLATAFSLVAIVVLFGWGAITVFATEPDGTQPTLDLHSVLIGYREVERLDLLPEPSDR